MPRDSVNLDLEDQNKVKENPDNDEGDNQMSQENNLESSLLDDYSKTSVPDTPSLTVQDTGSFEAVKVHLEISVVLLTMP